MSLRDVSNQKKFMIKPGSYRHFKGGKYKVLGVAKHSETLEELVIYQSKDRQKKLWVRPLDNFTEKVKIGNKKVPRFKQIK
ncbi:MAG: DUF1653 domain-containing protein [bacterium]|nr:DUF1653 domain-containing protein [bacterium]